MRRLRRGVSDGRADREVAHQTRPSRSRRDDDVRVLRRGMLVQGGSERRPGRAHGAGPQWPREPRARVRERSLCIRLRHAPRSHHDADDPQVDRRAVAAGQLGRGHRPRRERVPPDPGEIRPGLGWRDHVIALHQRRDVPRAEAGARGVWQQQRGHVRARLPLADRLRLEEHDWRVRRHAGVRLGHEGRRHHHRGRQPDRRASGVRLAAQAPVAAGREAHRHRPARNRPRPVAAHRSRLPPSAPARHQRRDVQRHRARDRDRRAHKGRVRRRALRGRFVPQVEGVRRRRAQLARSDRLLHGGRSRARAKGRAPLRDGRQRRHLLRSRRHRAQPGFDDGDVHRQFSDGHRQSRSRRRRRQPVARSEQRAGVVRHGIVPARVQRLSPRLRCRGSRKLRSRVGGLAAERTGFAHPQHARSRARRQLQRPVHPG